MQAARPAQKQNQAIVIYLAATLILTSVALGFWGTGFSNRYANVIRFVYFEPVAPGTDLTSNLHFANWHREGALVLQQNPAQMFNYCPFAFYILLFFVTAPYPVVTLGVFAGAWVLVFAAMLARAIAASYLALGALVLALCTSYPFGFLFERGNIEGTLWIPSAAGVYFFVKKRYLPAALCFALAASIKPFPAMLFLLLLARRRYREFLIGVAVVGVIAIGSLAILGPTVQTAFEETAKGFRIVSQNVVLVYNSPGNDHSLFGMIKFIIRALTGWGNEGWTASRIRKIYPFYMLFAGVLFCVSVYVLRKKPTLNQVFGISTLMILISPVNFDYTLIAMYIPWAMLLAALVRPDCRIGTGTASMLMVLCALLFTPQFYLMAGQTTCLAGLVKAVSLVGILAISALIPMPVAEYESV